MKKSPLLLLLLVLSESDQFKYAFNPYSWISRHKSTTRQLLGAASVLHILGNLALTILLLTISSNNYPGGAAIRYLHQVVPENETVNVHIDNFAAQTGVSRFTQLHKHWR